jgi:poly(3-hydroxyalkanoate) synthetase
MIASFAIGYIICGQVHTVLANFNTNIAAAVEEAIKIMSCRGVIESVNVIAGCIGGK